MARREHRILLTVRFKAYEDDINVRSQAPENLNIAGLQSNVETIYDGYNYQNNGLTIETFSVKHERFTHAFLVSKYIIVNIMVISGDTTYSERVIKKQKGAIFLIHEIAHASEHTMKKYSKAKGVIFIIQMYLGYPIS